MRLGPVFLGTTWGLWGIVKFPAVSRHIGFYGIQLGRLHIGFVWGGKAVKEQP